MELRYISSGVLFSVVILLAGCIKAPTGELETLEDFRRTFSVQKKSPPQLSGNLLTLEQAISASLVNNPTNLAAAQAVQTARYNYYRALSAYLPELNAGYSLSHTLTRGWDLKNPPVGVMKRNDHLISAGNLQASWLLFDGFARELETIIARQEYNKNREIQKDVQRVLKRAAAYAYYDIYLATEEIKIHQEDLIFQNDALLQEQERFRCGHVSKAPVLNFMILAARAKSNISTAEYNRKISLHALSALMGCDAKELPETFQLQKIPTDKLPQISDENYYLETAIKHRPDLEAEKIILDTAFRRRQKVYAEFLPEIRLFSGFSLDSYHAGYSGYRVSSARSHQGGFNYGIEGKWNLFRGLDSLNKLKEMTALEKTALWNLNAKFLAIIAEVRDARANCHNARYQTALYRDMSQWVREQRDIVYSEYRNGRETITRLNEAQSILVEMQRRLIASAVEFNKAAAQLAAAIGIEQPFQTRH